MPSLGFLEMFFVPADCVIFKKNNTLIRNGDGNRQSILDSLLCTSSIANPISRRPVSYFPLICQGFRGNGEKKKKKQRKSDTLRRHTTIRRQRNDGQQITGGIYEKEKKRLRMGGFSHRWHVVYVQSLTPFRAMELYNVVLCELRAQSSFSFQFVSLARFPVGLTSTLAVTG